ncbi:class I adenylate-forming enzyme family protein [Nonomuraea sp. LPB2021202275-12-8]|uniref:class I adenylate-forming enzyme family protein n=1 Tax=Nonomuraea sp. LPB2021202275-12-8 TaxID=3120159 RepID=UPI00300CF712
MSFGQAIVDGLRAAGPREVLARGPRRLTGDELLAMVSGAAGELEARGVRPGDAIACLNGRGLESVAGRLVAFALGCPAIQVLPGLPVEVAAGAMRALGATALLYEPDRQEEAELLLAACPVPVHGPFGRMLATPGARPVTLPVTRPDELSSVTFTGGTTGERKAVAYSHRTETAHFAAALAMLGSGPWRLMVWPGHHLPGLMAQWTLATAGTAVLADDGEDGWEVIARERVTHVLAGPPFGFYTLTRRLPAEPARVPLLLYGGAAAVPARTWEAAQRLGPALMQSYGLTEAGFVTALPPADHAYPGLLASVGRAVPGVELEVRDEDGAAVPVGEVGEVWVRSPQVMTGYVNDPRRTAEALRGGWVRTGDLGRLDGGYLFLVDRVENRLPPGVHAYPIEHVLTSHPAVADAAVIALRGPDGHAVTGAVVQMNELDTDTDTDTDTDADTDTVTGTGRDALGPDASRSRSVVEAALRELVRRSLGPSCEPGHLWLVDELPRTTAGKPDKAALLARFQPLAEERAASAPNSAGAAGRAPNGGDAAGRV